MARNLKEWTRQHRPLILVAGVLLAIGLLAAAVATVFCWNARGDRVEGTTNPILVDGSGVAAGSFAADLGDEPAVEQLNSFPSA